MRFYDRNWENFQGESWNEKRRYGFSFERTSQCTWDHDNTGDKDHNSTSDKDHDRDYRSTHDMDHSHSSNVKGVFGEQLEKKRREKGKREMEERCQGVYEESTKVSRAFFDP